MTSTNNMHAFEYRTCTFSYFKHQRKNKLYVQSVVNISALLIAMICAYIIYHENYPPPSGQNEGIIMGNAEQNEIFYLFTLGRWTSLSKNTLAKAGQ